MSIITKTEICGNVPASLPSLNFQALIGDMKRIESLSNEKIMALEARLKVAEDEAKSIRKQNEELKSSLAAKERDSKLYYDQYQSIAAQFEEFKGKLGKDVELPKLNQEKVEAEIEPAVVIFDTDTESEESHDETILFTSPALFSEPGSRERPIPTANSTTLANVQSEETKNSKLPTTTPPAEVPKLDTAMMEQPISKELSTKKPLAEKKKRPIATARKRTRSHSHGKSDAPLKKLRYSNGYTPRKLPTPTQFKCKTCPKLSFATMEEYHKHLNEIHPEKTYLCGYCPYATSKSCDIDAHIERTHTVGKKLHNTDFTCTLCKISFATVKSLGQHLRFYH